MHPVGARLEIAAGLGTAARHHFHFGLYGSCLHLGWPREKSFSSEKPLRQFSELPRIGPGAIGSFPEPGEVFVAVGVPAKTVDLV